MVPKLLSATVALGWRPFETPPKATTPREELLQLVKNFPPPRSKPPSSLSRITLPSRPSLRAENPLLVSHFWQRHHLRRMNPGAFLPSCGGVSSSCLLRAHCLRFSLCHRHVPFLDLAGFRRKDCRTPNFSFWLDSLGRLLDLLFRPKRS